MRGSPRSLAGVLFVLVILIGGWLVAEIGQQPESGIGSSDEATASVEQVVDGDTARVLLDGRSESVRYIGIDTPEMNYEEGQPDCFASQATDRNEELLGRDDQVRLVFDKEKRDRYGRLLAYVYSGPTLLQEELLKGGYATTLEVPPNTSMADRFSKLEDEARDAGRGGWGECGTGFGG